MRLVTEDLHMTSLKKRVVTPHSIMARSSTNTIPLERKALRKTKETKITKAH